ncbi:3-isopropylmalate dehydratase large subunit [Acuticoccus sp. M5D2P5]|uniref:3-isopropylmalate dehydratase large subunit n=1 Tax=Acuticoccus kalidii TaxID=2910977 RepID=UPI001F3D7439|nr:3-isopropylmalate dehydratase large subunit [Acuticoccus kalidii]MCF3933725.1 3-isopropylmalate dehydratase large subunit [Acuticoccus kalidii]
MRSRTLYEKIFDAHVVTELGDDRALLFVDRHLVHEGVATYARTRLAEKKRPVRRPDLTLGVADHTVPTADRSGAIDYADDDARAMVEDIEAFGAEAGFEVFSVRDRRQGIVHVVGPEQGFVLPGALVVCGDSHTSTHGAFGAYAFGIGISDVEHVLATQTIVQRRLKSMRVRVDGRLPAGTTAKDLVLTVLSRIGVAGGTGHVIEYAGEAIEALSMEGRMTLCNMSIEAGAGAGMIAPDETTFAYLKGRRLAPSGAAWDAALAFWTTLRSDPDATFDTDIAIDAADVVPTVTWGTDPGQSLPVDGVLPDPAAAAPEAAAGIAAALSYMGLSPGERIATVPVDRVFIGSCTNGRLEDLRLAASVVRGRRVAQGVEAWVVPGSGLVKAAAEAEGLDTVFREAGFAWREAGCSMCLAMNGEALKPGERCASTSNRNFEGRQGEGGRTHLMAPAMAAAAAIAGRITDVRDYL